MILCIRNSGIITQSKSPLKMLLKWRVEYIFPFFQGTTQLDHDLAGEQTVSSCREPGCSGHRVTYQVPMSHIIAITTLSKECEQHIQVGQFQTALSSLCQSAKNHTK